MDEIAILKEMVSIPSPSGHEGAVAEFLLGKLTALDFCASRDQVGNVVGVLGDPGAQRTIVLLGHMDTVPGDIPVRQTNGRLFGRGTVDAKGPLTAFLVAASRVAPKLKNTRILLIGAVEEETYGRGARHLARTMPAPYCAFVGEPSTWQGITLGYKGMLSFDYRLTQPGGHTAGETPGPAEKAVAFWNRLMTYAEEQNGAQFGRFNTIDPALRDFGTFSDGLDDGVDMDLVVRIPIGVRAEELEQSIRQWSNGAMLRFSPSDLPFQAEKNTPLVRAMLQAIRDAGGRPRFKLKTGTADMNIVGPVWGCPIVAYGPGDSSLDHTPNEHIEVAEFRRAVNVLHGALDRLID